MGNGDTIAYNIAVFISTLFLLEFGADKFVDHTAIVASRTGIPDTVIALLTAGAEWEELVVVVASLAQGRPSLAVGNIVGSAISNVLGAFSLGLLFHPTASHIEFDRSSKIYSLCLLVITTFVAPIIYFSQRIIWLVCGSILIAFFAIYLTSIGWAISRGSLIAPEGSDSDSSDDENDTSSVESTPSLRSPLLTRHEEHEPQDRNERDQRADGSRETSGVTNARTRRRRRSLAYHIGFLTLGFLAICLSGYVLSRAAINITDAVGMSDELFGIVILSIATTLPEKFIAVLSGNRGHVGILVANTVGSNVFLLSLCLGIVMVDTSGNFDGGNISVSELCVLWGSTLALTDDRLVWRKIRSLDGRGHVVWLYCIHNLGVYSHSSCSIFVIAVIVKSKGILSKAKLSSDEPFNLSVILSKTSSPCVLFGAQSVQARSYALPITRLRNSAPPFT